AESPCSQVVAWDARLILFDADSRIPVRRLPLGRRRETVRNSTAILLLMLLEGMSGCGGSNSTPAAPSTPTPPPPAQVQPARFTDPASGFTTSDVRDVQEQIVQFDTTSNSLIWGVDGRRFPGYPVSGNFIGSDKAFQVRFGMKDGQ